MRGARIKKILLVARPAGLPKLSDFSLAESDVPDLRSGEFLVEAHYLSADPLQRWRMDERAAYGATMALGGTVWGRMVGEVVRSRHRGWHEGEFAEGMLGWQTHAVSRGDTSVAGYAPGVRRVDPSSAPVSTALGVLGMPGVTAYFALTEICRPRAGDTVVISAAAGTVGSLAGQMAKLLGCRVVGIAGGEDKVRHVVEELGFDAAIDYRAAVDLGESVGAACPDGVDAYFDNVGGPVADAVYRHLAKGARVALVGRVAQLMGTTRREDTQEHVISARARIEGFLVYDYEARAEEARDFIGELLRSRRVRYRETMHQGIEAAPQALIDVLQGKGLGKHVVRIRASVEGV